MHSDHFHPGWNVIRATVAPLSRSTSIFVLSGVRCSSGVSNDFELTPAITALRCLMPCARGVRCPSTGLVIEQGPSRRWGDALGIVQSGGLGALRAILELRRPGSTSALGVTSRSSTRL